MALQSSTCSPEIDLFRQELGNLTNTRHPLVQLAAKIEWAACEQRFSSLYATGIGGHCHAIPSA